MISIADALREEGRQLGWELGLQLGIRSMRQDYLQGIVEATQIAALNLLSYGYDVRLVELTIGFRLEVIIRLQEYATY